VTDILDVVHLLRLKVTSKYLWLSLSSSSAEQWETETDTLQWWRLCFLKGL